MLTGPALQRALVNPATRGTPAAAQDVDDRTFSIIAGFLKRTSGFSLTPEKRYLIGTRLNGVAANLGLKSPAELALALSQGPTAQLERLVMEAMTTNETLFFRDQKPFDALRTQLIPALVTARGEGRLRILCAAASTGQEPYSIAMSLRECGVKLDGWQIEIVATDIDETVLRRAGDAVYSQFEVQRGVPTPLLLKYFTPQPPSNWRLTDAIRKMVKFQSFNLMDEMSALGTFDIVFCRNVLLYFDIATKAKVLAKISRQMTAGGHLFLGCAETVIGICDGFSPVDGVRGLYRRSPPTALAPTR